MLRAFKILLDFDYRFVRPNMVLNNAYTMVYKPDGFF